VAWRRALAQHSAAEQISARHSERNICRNFDRDVARDVQVANVWLAEHLKKSLAARTRPAPQPQFTTSPDRLRVVGLTADHLAELVAAGQKLESTDVAVRLLAEGDHFVLALGVGDH
jgi:hypothetical protein